MRSKFWNWATESAVKFVTTLYIIDTIIFVVDTIIFVVTDRATRKRKR